MIFNMKCKICNNKTKIIYKKMYDDRHGFPGKYNVEQCFNCGFMQTTPQLSVAKLYKLYTNYYPKRDSNIEDVLNYSKNIPSQKVISSNGLSTACHYLTKKGQKVLDVGCGTCQSLLEIKSLGGEAWGLDVDKNSQNVAKKLKLRFHLGTIHNCIFKKDFFNLITASQVIEHEPDPISFLKDCMNFLKDDGKIILSFPNTDSLGLKLWGKKWLHWHMPFHLNHFSKNSAILMIKNAGLKIESIRTITPNLWTILQIRSYLSYTKEGKRNEMWDGKEMPISSRNKSVKYRLLNILMSNFQSMFIVNRFIDAIGMGESLVITVSK